MWRIQSLVGRVLSRCHGNAQLRLSQGHHVEDEVINTSILTAGRHACDNSSSQRGEDHQDEKRTFQFCYTGLPRYTALDAVGWGAAAVLFMQVCHRIHSQFSSAHVRDAALIQKCSYKALIDIFSKQSVLPSGVTVRCLRGALQTSEPSDSSAEANHANSDWSAEANHANSDWSAEANHANSDWSADASQANSDWSAEANHANSDWSADASQANSDWSADANYANGELSADANHVNNDWSADANYANGNLSADASHANSARSADANHANSARSADASHANSARSADASHANSARSADASHANGDWSAAEEQVETVSASAETHVPEQPKPKESLTPDDAALKLKHTTDSSVPIILNIIGVENARAGDCESAFLCFLASAQHNYSKAQFNVGVCYEKGRGVQQDLNKAVQYYRRAASAGHPQAQCRCAKLLLSSRGQQRADAGLTEATVRGHKQAKDAHRREVLRSIRSAPCFSGIGQLHLNSMPPHNPGDVKPHPQQRRDWPTQPLPHSWSTGSLMTLQPMTLLTLNTENTRNVWTLGVR